MFLRRRPIAQWICIRWCDIVIVLYRPELGSYSTVTYRIFHLGLPFGVWNLVVSVDFFKSRTGGQTLFNWICECCIHNFIGSFFGHLLHGFKCLGFACFFCFWSLLTDNFLDEPLRLLMKNNFRSIAILLHINVNSTMNHFSLCAIMSKFLRLSVATGIHCEYDSRLIFGHL